MAEVNRDAQIGELLRVEQEHVDHLMTIPGVGRRTAEIILAEVGCDMSRFATSAHLASWARICPGNHDNAGKRYSSSTGRGNNWLRTALTPSRSRLIAARMAGGLAR